MLEITAKEFQGPAGRQFLVDAFAAGGGRVISRHSKNKYPDRDLVLTAVEVDLSEVKFIPARKLYAGTLTEAARAISNGIQYVHNRKTGNTFKMDLVTL